MKKILFVAAFIGMSYLGMAQNAPKKAPATQNSAVTTAPASVNTVEAATTSVPTDAVAPATNADIKGNKKECSPADKKQCGTEKKGKACCSKKTANQ